MDTVLTRVQSPSTTALDGVTFGAVGIVARSQPTVASSTTPITDKPRRTLLMGSSPVQVFDGLQKQAVLEESAAGRGHIVRQKVADKATSLPHNKLPPTTCADGGAGL